MLLNPMSLYQKSVYCYIPNQINLTQPHITNKMRGASPRTHALSCQLSPFLLLFHLLLCPRPTMYSRLTYITNTFTISDTAIRARSNKLDEPSISSFAVEDHVGSILSMAAYIVQGLLNLIAIVTFWLETYQHNACVREKI
jgi:hypothetical protein